MTTQENIAATEAFGNAVNTGEFAGFDQLVAPDNVDHDPAPGQGPGPDGYRSFFGGMRTAFPDLHIEVEHLVAQDDSVAFAYTLTGTHLGPFQGHEATTKQIEVRGVQVGSFENGTMVERWGSTDELGMMSQLGLS